MLTFCVSLSAKPDRSLVDSQIFTKHGGAIVTAARELLLNVGNEVQGKIFRCFQSHFQSTVGWFQSPARKFLFTEMLPSLLRAFLHVLSGRDFCCRSLKSHFIFFLCRGSSVSFMDFSGLPHKRHAGTEWSQGKRGNFHIISACAPRTGHHRSVAGSKSPRECFCTVTVDFSVFTLQSYVNLRDLSVFSLRQKLVEALTCLPCKVLSSSVYNVGSLTSTAVMKGCPALSLVELLFQEKILNLCIDEER